MQPLFKDPSYTHLLGELKGKIRNAQIKAMVSVNQQLLRLYWEIGKSIINRLEAEKWGSKVFHQLSKDLKSSFPDMKGFSVRNLQYMRRFAFAYPDFTIVQAPLAQLSWYHNITLLSKCAAEKERLGD